jgi:hypothetical protein
VGRSGLATAWAVPSARRYNLTLDSSWEGFPLASAERRRLSLPFYGFSCPSSPWLQAAPFSRLVSAHRCTLCASGHTCVAWDLDVQPWRSPAFGHHSAVSFGDVTNGDDQAGPPVNAARCETRKAGACGGGGPKTRPTALRRRNGRKPTRSGVKLYVPIPACRRCPFPQRRVWAEC